MSYKNFKNLNQLKNQFEVIEHIDDISLVEHWAAVHLIFHRKLSNDKNSPLSVAMIRRVENENDPWSGHYAFPGGGVNMGEGLKEASFRETKEEIGLEIPASSYLGEFYRIQVAFDGRPSKLAISAHASFIESALLPRLIPCPIEVDAAFWFPLSDLLSNNSITYRKFHFSKISKELPCISFDGHTLWGLSYIIFREFLMQWEVLSGHEVSTSIGDHLPDYSYRRK